MSEEKKHKKANAPREHFCPTCDQKATGVMTLPKRKMVYTCANGHSSRKGQCVLK